MLFKNNVVHMIVMKLYDIVAWRFHIYPLLSTALFAVFTCEEKTPKSFNPFVCMSTMY